MLNIHQWSDESGVLLEVPVAHSKIDPASRKILGDGLIVIGPGHSIVDAAASALDAPPPILPGIPSGYELSDTYFVWAVVISNRVEFHPEFAEATKSLLNDIRQEHARRLADLAASRASKIVLLENMGKHYASLAVDGKERNTREQLRQDLQTLSERLTRNEQLLRSEIARAQAIARARAFVDQLAPVLSFASLVANAASAVDQSERSDLEKTKSTQELLSVLNGKLLNGLENVGRLKAVMAKDKEAFGTRTSEVMAIFENAGAPRLLSIRFVAPIEFWTPPETPKN